MRSRILVVLGCLAVCGVQAFTPADAASGRIVDVPYESRALSGNLLNVDVQRRIKVYLPASYESGSARYPVVYYIHNYHWSPTRTFEENRLQDFFERAAERGQIGEVILVAGDFTTPTGFNFFGNDRVAGRWVDHVVDELVPLIDARFRTRATSASRGLAGDFFGGFAALKFAMERPGVFGAVYALHPVATGSGEPGFWRPDWRVVHAAKNWEDLRRDTYAPIFVAMAQAYLPNPDRPPFYCDFMVEPQDGELKPHTRNIITLQSRFLLDERLEEHAESLKQLRGLKIDWGRYDPVQGHVYANHAFTRKLEGYAVAHFAEEYAGNQWNRLWTPHGRVEDDLVPFFADFLEGASPSARR
jgi:hypothetical protein